MQSKKIAVFAALAAVGVLMHKLNDNYGRLDSQDAEFKSLLVDVDTALALPDDPEVVEKPAFEVLPADEVRAIVESIGARIPAPLDVQALVAGITEQIEHSDLAVLGAIAETRGELVAALKPAA